MKFFDIFGVWCLKFVLNDLGMRGGIYVDCVFSVVGLGWLIWFRFIEVLIFDCILGIL